MSLRDLMDKCPSFAHLRQGPLWGVSLSISGDSWQREQYCRSSQVWNGNLRHPVWLW